MKRPYKCKWEITVRGMMYVPKKKKWLPYDEIVDCSSSHQFCKTKHRAIMSCKRLNTNLPKDVVIRLLKVFIFKGKRYYIEYHYTRS